MAEASRVRLNESLRGSPLDSVELTIENGASSPFATTDYIRMDGHSVAGIVCPASVGALTTFTAQVSLDGTNWVSHNEWAGITPVADTAFQLGATDIWGFPFVRFIGDQDPTADITFTILLKAI